MNKKGFTLVEVMIVLLIVGILMLVTIPSVLRSKMIANETMAQSTLNVIGKSLEMYSNEYFKYPDNIIKIIPYTRINFFHSSHNGYVFGVILLEDYQYIIFAIPGNSDSNMKKFMMTTGGIISEE